MYRRRWRWRWCFMGSFSALPVANNNGDRKGVAPAAVFYTFLYNLYLTMQEVRKTLEIFCCFFPVVVDFVFRMIFVNGNRHVNFVA